MYIRFVFYHNINCKENVVFFSERELKKALRASSVVWTLIDNVKLVNQIARFVAIVVKTYFYHGVAIRIR